MKKSITQLNRLIPGSTLRARFAHAMSNMYRYEVPMYGSLLDMVQQINQQELDTNPELRHELKTTDALQRLTSERHGAIRLGKAQELFTMRRLFAVMGMFPVGYYDLTEAGIPVHSTAFRPIQLDELNTNPFRIFTSLLRLDLIQDKTLREQAEQLLSQRDIFTPGLIKLIETFEQQNGLNAQQAEQFIAEALVTFRWHQQATVDMQTYQSFLRTHRLIADIVCFRGPHINHLTPRTLNIDTAQQQMTAYGMQPKAIIEGPPRRQHPILLRQTSFRALQEEIEFIGKDGNSQIGSHTARFGEIEQRGMALTPNGRTLYDQLLNEVRERVPNATEHVAEYYRQLEIHFSRFPDNLQQIHRQRLAYFNYRLNTARQDSDYTDLDALIENDILHISPITYEDFLPVSAAGIFHSNLDERDAQDFSRSPNQQAFEKDLGCAVINEFELYARIQRDSLTDCLQQLGLDDSQQLALINQLDKAA